MYAVLYLPHTSVCAEAERFCVACSLVVVMDGGIYNVVQPLINVPRDRKAARENDGTSGSCTLCDQKKRLKVV